MVVDVIKENSKPVMLVGLSASLLVSIFLSVWSLSGTLSSMEQRLQNVEAHVSKIPPVIPANEVTARLERIEVKQEARAREIGRLETDMRERINSLKELLIEHVRDQKLHKTEAPRLNKETFLK